MPKISSAKIQEIQNRIKERNNKKNNFNKVDENFYPFWLMEEGQETKVRIIPDIDPENELPYYIKSLTHKLTIDGKEWKVTCPKTFDTSSLCPICDRSQKFYREGNKERGGYYYRDCNYLTRLLVLTSPIKVEDSDGKPVDYTGRVCTSSFGKQVLEAFEESMGRLPQDANAPWVFTDGYNFNIKKTSQGEHVKYTYSYFDHNPSSLPQEFVDTIELISYKDLLPAHISLEKVQHFLDAHDGVVKLDLKQFGGASDAADDDNSGHTHEPQTNHNTITIPSNPTGLTQSVDSNPQESTSSSSDSEADFLAQILMRNKRA